MAGMEGVEPPLTEPESAVLPLDDIPMTASLRSAVPLRKKEIYGKSRRDASPNFDFFEIQSNWPNLVQPVKDLWSQPLYAKGKTPRAVAVNRWQILP